MRLVARPLTLACLLAPLCACPSTSSNDDSLTTFNLETTGDGDGDPTGDGDGEPSSCGNGVVDDGEQCDLGSDNSATGQCTPDCQIAACGDGYVADFEDCDDGNAIDTDACVDSCQLARCGDGHTQAGVEMCDDGNDDETDGCNSRCLPGSCGDGVVQEGEQCDDGNADTSDECPACQLAFCGDGFMQAGLEQCDDGNTLDDDACVSVFCTPAECGDGFVYAGVEQCDDGNLDDDDACPSSCMPAECGDGFVHAGMEECDDGNDVDDDTCDNACELNIIACQNGAVNLATSPNSDMVVCDDPDDDPINGTCEQDGETLCPVGWGLCTHPQYTNRNTGWNYALNGNVVVGEIYCRPVSGAGHYTLSGATLETDYAFNCSFGSSRDSCPANYGCNELSVHMLCCAPTPTCGNGVVDHVEEQCDDGNQDENDACLNSCAPRYPGC